MTDPPPEPTPAREPRGNWAALFQQTTDAIFLLNPRGRLRYVNRAWTAVTKTAPEAALHEYCLPRKIKRAAPAALRALLQAMAPPADAWLGRTVAVRRPVPPAKLGPPWWDITFVPFREGDRVVALVGIIVIVPTAGGSKNTTSPSASWANQVIPNVATGWAGSESIRAQSCSGW